MGDADAADVGEEDEDEDDGLLLLQPAMASIAAMPAATGSEREARFLVGKLPARFCRSPDRCPCTARYGECGIASYPLSFCW